MIKAKAGIRTRVFVSFGFFVLVIINLFVFALYNLIGSSHIQNIQHTIEEHHKKLSSQIQTSANKNTFINNISPETLREIENDGLFLSIAKENQNIEKRYALGTFLYDDLIVSRNDIEDYNIILGKDVKDLNNFRESIIDQILFINLFSVFIVFAMSYFVADRVLTPLLKLAKKLGNYDIEKNNAEIENKYGGSEIGIITDATNKFIKNSKNILENQKQFIQDSSHELKTPLMQIESNLELLEEKITDEKILTKLQGIRNSTENINTIVSNLSFIMRGEERITQKESINMQAYLENYVKNFYSLANEKNITILVETKKNFHIENSSYYLDRLFGNLLQNAIFYNEGNSKIQIIIEEKKITVQDQGIGMSNTELTQIFSRFYRNSNSNIYNKNGNGLGLTIVQKICSDFNWKLEVTSQRGKGSIFTIQF